MKKWLRTIALIVALMTALSAAVAESAVVFNTASRVYQYADLFSAYLPVNAGTSATLTGMSNGWAMVQINGIPCYTNPAHLTEIVPQSECLSLLATAKDAVTLRATRVYAFPSEGAASVKLPQGFALRRLKELGDWALVEKNGCFAYAPAEDLGEPVPVPDYSALLAEAKDAVITVNTRVYAAPSLAAASVKASKGTTVKLLSVSGDWALVEKSGIYAYISAAAVSESVNYAALLANAKDAVFTADAPIYRAPDTASASIAIPKGTEVKLLTVNGGWALVMKNGIYAYVKAENVGEKTEPAVDYAALLANAKDAVFNADARIYRAPDTASDSLRAAKGTEVKLLAINAGWALVMKGGIYAYTLADNVSEKVETAAPDYSALLANAIDAVILTDTFVYQAPDASSASTTIAKDTAVRLLAINGGWALVERNGFYGYLSSDRVTAAPAPKPSPADYMSSSKYSNEEKCYLFLTCELGYNCAVACGILSNIYSECTFRPTLGTDHYGLCQWGGGRLSNLKKYCESNGYDLAEIEGQLRFMDYELKNAYSSIGKKLAAIENTAEGAYDAGYIFCYEFERPGSKATASEKRGNRARDTYFAKYQSW